MLISVSDRVALEQRLGLLNDVRVAVVAAPGPLSDAVHNAFRRTGSQPITVSPGCSEPNPTSTVQTHLETQGTRVGTLRALQAAFSKLGGLDIVINIISARNSSGALFATRQAVEAGLSAQFRDAATAIKVSADRMALTRNEGTIISILDTQPECGDQNETHALLSRHLLQTMTRAEAEKSATSGIRINAVAPHISPPGQQDCAIALPEDIAELTVFLAGRQSPELSGLTFAPDEILDLAVWH